MPIKLGELLVEENLITPQQLQEALQYQKQNGGKLGYNLVKLGFVKDEEISQLLSRQYGVPSINLARFEIDPSVIKLVPAETAQKYQVIPLARGREPHDRDGRSDERLRDGRHQIHDGLQRGVGRCVCDGNHGVYREVLWLHPCSSD